MYQFYSECTAMCSNAASFNVEIVFRNQFMGEGNVIINKEGNYSVLCRETSREFFKRLSDKELEDLNREMGEHCYDRAKCIFDTN